MHDPYGCQLVREHRVREHREEMLREAQRWHLARKLRAARRGEHSRFRDRIRTALMAPKVEPSSISARQTR